jgi:hypothetical protein
MLRVDFARTAASVKWRRRHRSLHESLARRAANFGADPCHHRRIDPFLRRSETRLFFGVRWKVIF